MIRQAVTLGNLPALIYKLCKKNPPLERHGIRDFSKKSLTILKFTLALSRELAYIIPRVRGLSAVGSAQPCQG